MSDVAFLRETELALMNAPFQPDGWARAIDMVARATGSSSANLVAIGGPLLLPLNMFTGRDSDRAAAYFAQPELWGACNWRVQSSGKPMTVQHEEHYAAARAIGGTADYDDAVSDLDMQYGCQSVLLSDARNFLGLAILRGRKEGPCNEVTLRRFQHLIRQVQRSTRMQLALDGEAADLMLGQLASMKCRVVLLDRHGCLAALTEAAEELLADAGPARLSGLTFELTNAEEDRHLHRAMARLLAGPDDHGPQLHEMRVGRSVSSPHGDWRLTICRLPSQPCGLGFEPQVTLSFHPIESCA